MNVPSWLLIVLASVATCQLTETIRHGSIFAGLRARIEARGPLWSEWIGCGFCFSHSAAAMAVLLIAGHLVLSSRGWIVDPFVLALIWLTAVRGANLLNDLTKTWSRSPSGKDIDVDNVELHDGDPLSTDDNHADPPGSETY